MEIIIITGVLLNVLVYLFAIIFGFCIAVVAHELAHLVCGLLSGYRFRSFRLLQWLWTRDASGKLKVTKSARIAGILGQCLMEPCEDEKDFRFLLYNAGGGLINLIMGTLFLIPLFILSIDDSVMWLLLGMGVSSLMLGIVNLIPMQSGGIPNDGRNIMEAKKSAAAKHGFYMTLKINADMSRGKRLTDYGEDAFAVDPTADINNFFVALLFLFRAGQLEEAEDYKQSYHMLLQPATENLPLFYGAQFVLDLMFHELVYFGDAISVGRARARIGMKAKDKRFMRFFTMKHPVFIPYQAAKAAFLDNDKTKALELTRQARRLNVSQQNPGAEHSLTLLLNKLEERIAELEV